MRQVIIALVGKPNVGKSTLFNRLSLKEKSIVHDLPGITRDRKYANANLFSDFVVVDTPGLDFAAAGSIEFNMMQQSLVAINEANIICFVVDAITGILPIDEECASLIRKHHKQSKTILVINKTEKPIILDRSYYKLGFSELVCISAKHGQGIYELGDIIQKILSKDNLAISDNDFNSNRQQPELQLAIVGRPNCGKSTFINAVLNEERVLTGPESGLTRNSIEIDWEYSGQLIRLIDTAGVRKKNVVTQSYELLSVNDTLKNIRFANVVTVMIDATRGLEQQDLSIINYAANEGRGIVLVVNKWDLVKKKEDFQKEFKRLVAYSVFQIKGINPIYISAKEKFNLDSVLEHCLLTYASWQKRITTGTLNQWLAKSVSNRPLPFQSHGKRVKIKYCTQTKTRPPTIKLFCNNVEAIDESYRRYLINNFKLNFDIAAGVPVRLSFTKGKNPYYR
ncbi:ribosome-associated GTPase EngA [Orientia chuto str. Dubai]|uniref:GTPase Der n=1 Tax=Orientia chuto str. Dubai TaxID=1359168 RepID=A0A0F3MKP8_9RICK|nr:ribosome biogenesis GTPase Der [Candidatus Orientia mediorientalis]KJV55154.1 ribosome-associated GTPase EngA [Orientia chuto str. Dubai]